jgi:glucose 1-dehydrogenase
MSRFPSARLDGKVAVVTGASSGIGFAIAEAMAEAGARLVLQGRDEERLARCAERVGEHRVVAVDLTDDEAPGRIVGAALDAFGALNVVVHSAGIFRPKPVEQAPLSDFDLQWRVNVRAPYALTQAAVPHLKGDGAVIFVSSIAGHAAFPGSAAYCATKGAVELMAKALATELAAHNVRVNALAPGNVRTAMNEELLRDPEYERSMVERTPAGRVGLVEDIAPAAVFLASEAARYVHGASLLVDGGWVAQ